MQLEERLTEASGEGGSRLCDAALCTGELSGKAREEVVLSLLGSEDRYGRQYAERVRGKEDYVLGSGTRRNAVDVLRDFLDVLDGIGNTGVLGNALVVEVDNAVFFYGYVLEKRVSLDSVVDVGLALLVKTDNLSIAAALKVEYAVVVPAVLVVADKQTLGVGGKGGLACTRKSEEDSCVLAFHVGVCGAVH